MNLSLLVTVSDLLDEVAQAAILPHFRRLAEGDIEEKTPGELVTVADREAEALLSRRLPDLLPGSRVIGEEACAADHLLLSTLDDGPVWLVDPLDGTSNFVEGRSPFATMVALLVDGTTQMAWIFDPVSGRKTVAELGNGAWIDGVRVRTDTAVPQMRELSGAILQRFLPPDLKASILERAKRLARVLPGTKCAGADYPAIALREQHFALFWRALAWDHAPGALILSEAGGKVARLDGSAYHPSSQGYGLLAAHNAGIWDLLQHVLIDGEET
jgi:fructose-1,6-bisphosphatase/inositol monophosphatase family enzyme